MIRYDVCTSALVEGLMGFQFNHVGQGTKTRCPVTIQLKYNPDCKDPVCYLVKAGDGQELSEEKMELDKLRVGV